MGLSLVDEKKFRIYSKNLGVHGTAFCRATRETPTKTSKGKRNVPGHNRAMFVRVPRGTGPQYITKGLLSTTLNKSEK